MLACQKEQFSLPDDAHYLNCAYMSPVSKAVEAAGLQGIQAKRVPASIKPDDFFQTVAEIKTSFGHLVNAPASSISIIPAASYGIATAAQNVPLERGQNIVIVGEQFPSNVYSWMRKADACGASLRIVSAPELSSSDTSTSRGKVWNSRILESIDSRTAIVAMANVHWADGTLFDVNAVAQRARDVGAVFIIDGTQSVGALPFDVAAIQPDALICAGYKWLLGPYSIGAAYYGPRFSKGIPLEENWITRKGSENFGGLVQYEKDYQPGAERFDVGEKSNFILAPMLLRALEHLKEWKIPEIQSYCRRLIAPFCQEIEHLGFSIENSDWRADHLFGVRVRKDIPMERLMNAITEAKISVSIRGTAVRISPNVYNTEEDMAAISEVFSSVAKNPAAINMEGQSVFAPK